MENLEDIFLDDTPQEEVVVDLGAIDVDELEGLESPGYATLTEGLEALRDERFLVSVPFALFEDVLGESSELFKFIIRERSRQQSEIIYIDFGRLCAMLYPDISEADADTRARLRRNVQRRFRAFVEKTSWVAYLGRIGIRYIDPTDIFLKSRDVLPQTIPLIMLSPRIIVRIPRKFLNSFRHRDCPDLSHKTRNLIEQTVAAVSLAEAKTDVMQITPHSNDLKNEKIPAAKADMDAAESSNLDILDVIDAPDGEAMREIPLVAYDALLERSIEKTSAQGTNAPESVVANSSFDLLGKKASTLSVEAKVLEARQKAAGIRQEVNGQSATKMALQHDEESIIQHQMEELAFDVQEPSSADTDDLTEKEEEVDDESAICGACYSQVQEEDEVCPTCGAVLSNTIQEIEQKKSVVSKGLAAVFSMLGLTVAVEAMGRGDAVPDNTEEDTFLDSVVETSDLSDDLANFEGMNPDERLAASENSFRGPVDESDLSDFGDHQVAISDPDEAVNDEEED